MPEKNIYNPYVNDYPYKPIVLNAAEAFDMRIVIEGIDGSLLIDPSRIEDKSKARLGMTTKFTLPPEKINQAMLVEGMLGLQSRILSGTPYRKMYDIEFAEFSNALEKDSLHAYS